MPVVTLTDRFCSSAKTASDRIDYFDGKTQGLALRVARSGRKVFTLHFTSPDGKRARLTLGSYPAVSLARARTRAIESLGQAEEGTDPRSNGADTVAALATRYLEKHVRPRLRSAAATERRLAKNVLPVIGERACEELHKRDINRVIDPVLERGKQVEAVRCFEDMRAMFRWAVSRGDLDHSPMEGMKKPATPKPRERVLSDDEVRQLWHVLPDALPKSKACQQIIQLCLLTAQRVGEVAGMERDELDMESGVWTIPASRSKNKHAHAVPLTDAAVAIIKEAKGDRFLFPNKEGHGALSSHAVAHTVRLAQDRFGLAQWTTHDLRRTAVTNMAKLGVAPVVLGHVVNHRSVTRAGVTMAVYSQYDYAKEKRQALDLWADQLMAIVGGGAEVVPMRQEA